MDIGGVQEALDRETARAQQIAISDPEHMRTEGDQDSFTNVPGNALSSEHTFVSFLQSLKTQVIPQWHWEVIPDIRPDLDCSDLVVGIQLVNASPMTEVNPNREVSIRARKGTTCTRVKGYHLGMR